MSASWIVLFYVSLHLRVTHSDLKGFCFENMEASLLQVILSRHFVD